MVNFKEDEQLKTLNHSCAHVMAQAIKHLYPQAKFWVGPVVAEGFYYDIDLGEDVIRDEDIEKITKEMKKVVKSGKKIIRREVSKEEALEMFADDPYKLDLIADLEEGNITVYDQGDFTDLCRGPHVDNVKLCKYHQRKSRQCRRSLLCYAHQLFHYKSLLSNSSDCFRQCSWNGFHQLAITCRTALLDKCGVTADKINAHRLCTALKGMCILYRITAADSMGERSASHFFNR